MKLFSSNWNRNFITFCFSNEINFHERWYYIHTHLLYMSSRHKRCWSNWVSMKNIIKKLRCTLHWLQWRPKAMVLLINWPISLVQKRPKSMVQFNGDLLHELHFDRKNRDLFQSTPLSRPLITMSKNRFCATKVKDRHVLCN